MGGSGGTSPGRVRPRGNIEELASGSLRVRVYAGVDVLTGRELYLRELVPAGRDAWLVAERVRDELLRQVWEGRQPRTNASLAQLLEAHLAASPVQRRVKETQLGYVRKHVGPLLGERPIGGVTAGVLDAFYAELRRCRDHCDGRPAVAHHVEGAHRCDQRCRAHVCRPLAAWTVRQIHYLISGAYQSAIRWEWVVDNPTRRLRRRGCCRAG